MPTIHVAVPKYESRIRNTYGKSVWSPEYLKLLISKEASTHDWTLDIEKNEAVITAANNHKFFMQFNRSLGFVSCSCKKFMTEELNWCQHLATLKHYVKGNYSDFHELRHELTPNILFYNPSRKEYLLPGKKKPLERRELCKLDAVLAHSLTNLRRSITKPEGLVPKILNPFSPTSAYGHPLADEITLYSYQNTAVKHMMSNKRTILSLDMGWGKTICAIICCAHILEKQPDAKILIVCPKSLKNQWEKEILRFLPEVSIQNMKTSKEANLGKTFTILNYELVRGKSTNLGLSKGQQLGSFYEIIIMDEVQKIKNKKTKSWKAIAEIGSEWCWALSGTVVENNVEDFLSIADILRPDLFQARWKFFDRFCEMDKKYIKGFKNSAELDRVLAKILYRAPLGENPLSSTLSQAITRLPMGTQQRIIHNRHYAEVRRLLAMAAHRPLTFSQRRWLSACQTKSRLAADSPRLLGIPGDSPKITQILDIISQLPLSEKVVIFSEWKVFLDILEEEFLMRNIQFVRFDGSLSQKKRKEKIAEFVENPDVRIFCSTDAGGIGVDGLQTAAKTLIHCQMPWNPARLEQRNGRLLRIGQVDDVTSHILISTDSIEESMVETHARKTLYRKTIVGA